MKTRTRGLAALIVGAIAVLIFVLISNGREPNGQPSPVPSPTASTATSSSLPTASSSSSPAPSSSSVPTATTSTPSLSPSSQPSGIPVRTPPGEPITEGGSGATDLSSLGFCEPDAPAIAAMALSWRPGGGGAQLVAISTRPDGFETGRYTVSENLPASQRQFTVSPVEAGGVYYWRVLTRSGQDWIASKVATFTGPTCAIDTP